MTSSFVKVDYIPDKVAWFNRFIGYTKQWYCFSNTNESIILKKQWMAATYYTSRFYIAYGRLKYKDKYIKFKNIV